VLRRIGASAIVLVVLACTLTVQTLEAAVAHVRCEAHGELTHVRTSGTQVATPDAGSHLVGRSGTPRAEHEHCLMTAARHCIQLAVAAAPVAILEAVVVVRSVAPPDYLACAPLRYAPKTSPPA
jgi:hypothetical protein